MKRREFIVLGLSATLVLPTLADWETTGTKLSAAEIETVLKMHNQARAEVGVQPLSWSKDLAQSSQVWAEYLAREGKFEHSGIQYGENLAGGSSVEQAMQLWLDEKSLYRPGSRGADFAQAGHYTQMVWGETKQVGCGFAPGQQYDIYVCQYDPRGNIVGRDPY